MLVYEAGPRLAVRWSCSMLFGCGNFAALDVGATLKGNLAQLAQRVAVIAADIPQEAPDCISVAGICSLSHGGSPARDGWVY